MLGPPYKIGQGTEGFRGGAHSDFPNEHGCGERNRQAQQPEDQKPEHRRNRYIASSHGPVIHCSPYLPLTETDHIVRAQFVLSYRIDLGGFGNTCLGL